MTTVEEHNFKIAVEHAGDVDFIRYLGKLTARGIKYRSEITHVSVTQSVTQAPFTPRSYNSGEEFEPVEIEHRAYIFEGDFYRNSTVFGRNHDNISLYEDQLDGWPAAPSWFNSAADRMRAL